MKKPTIVLLLLLAVFYSYAQQIKAYEYWVDDDLSAKVVASIAPVQNLHLQQELSVNLVCAGFHVFNIRFADANNTWSSILSQYFVKNPQANSGTRQIVGYEYWFDDGYIAKTYQQITPVAQFHLADNLNLNSLSYGAHVLNIRFKDDIGSWSTILNQFFVNLPPTNSSNRQIVAYEYWFDDGYPTKTYQQITPASVFHLAENLNLNSVPIGLHVLNIRFRDDFGSWSTLLTQFFINYGTLRIIPNQTVAYRFWFDNDMATEETFNLPQPAPVYNWADTVETPFLTVGNHTFNYQFKDSNQAFSSIRTDTFSVASCLPHGGRVIAGAASVCVGQTGVVYSIRKIKNAPTYTWSVPSGATIIAGSNTQSITVDYSMASASGDVSVYATNSCGNGGTMTFPVTVHQLPLPTLAGENTVCSGTSGWVYTTESGNSNYDWSVSAGGTITGGGTNTSSTLTITWHTAGPQTVSVNYMNANSCTAIAPTVYNVAVNLSPAASGSISGPAQVIQGQTGVGYTVTDIANANGYIWSLPGGATITSGFNTSSIIVDFGPAAVSGDISVHGTNAFCSGAESPALNVQVIPTSLSLENVSIGSGQINCYSAVQSINVAGNGTTFAVQNGAVVHLIAGHNILFNPGTTVYAGGSLHAYISTDGVYCSNPKNSIVTNPAEINDEPIMQQEISSTCFFKIYPNPTTGSFTLELKGDAPVNKITVEIYGMRGDKVLTEVMNGVRKHEFSLANRSTGLYFIRVISGNKSETVKIIKQ